VSDLPDKIGREEPLNIEDIAKIVRLVVEKSCECPASSGIVKSVKGDKEGYSM
jgi:hypothetical protein